MSEIPDGSVQCVVTSPPYWGLRDYGHDGQIGLEQTPQEYVAEMVAVFREVWRVLADDGVLWLNLGDSYKPAGNGSTKKGLNERYFGKSFSNDKQGAEENHLDRSRFSAHGVKHKDLVGIPWRVAFALQDDGWYLRQDIIWHKPNPMPESVTDRCTKSHEYVFLLTKNAKYYFDDKAIAEPAKTKPGATWQERKAAGATAGNVILGHPTRNGTQRVVHGKGVTSNLTRQDGKRNKRSVWTIPTRPFKGAHFAVMPEALVEPCILAGSRPGDTIFDPFTGSGTVAVVALNHGRNYIGTELNPQYANIAQNRITESGGGLFTEIVLR
jgi:DNA modification methylase